MSLEAKAISMEPVAAKLKNLQKHMPGQHSTLYSFGGYLADRLGSESTPGRFNAVARTALLDLQFNESDSEVPMPNTLTGLAEPAYDALKLSIPHIAEAVCPEDFAEEVQKAYAANEMLGKLF